jgi:hypothetical protein
MVLDAAGADGTSEAGSEVFSAQDIILHIINKRVAEWRMNSILTSLFCYYLIISSIASTQLAGS